MKSKRSDTDTETSKKQKLDDFSPYVLHQRMTGQNYDIKLQGLNDLYAFGKYLYKHPEESQELKQKLLTYIKLSPTLKELFDLWNNLIEQKDISNLQKIWESFGFLLIECRHDKELSKPIFEKIIEDYQKYLYQPPSSTATSAYSCLFLWTQMTLNHPQQMCEDFNFQNGNLTKWLKQHQSREQMIRLICAFLTGDLPEKSKILGFKTFFTLIFKQLHKDSTYFITFLFKHLSENVLKDTRIPKHLLFNIFDQQNLELLSSLYWEKPELTSELDKFLQLLVLEPPFGLAYPPMKFFPKDALQNPNRPLFSLLNRLEPQKHQAHRNLLLKLLSKYPELIALYWQSTSQSQFEPKPEEKWLEWVHLTLEIFKIPLINLTDGSSLLSLKEIPNFKIFISHLMPTSLQKHHLIKGLRHSNLLIQYTSAVLCLNCFRKMEFCSKQIQLQVYEPLEQILDASKEVRQLIRTEWEQFELEIKKYFQMNFPDLQTLLYVNHQMTSFKKSVTDSKETSGDSLYVQLVNQEAQEETKNVFNDFQDSFLLHLQCLKLIQFYMKFYSNDSTSIDPSKWIQLIEKYSESEEMKNVLLDLLLQCKTQLKPQSISQMLRIYQNQTDNEKLKKVLKECLMTWFRLCNKEAEIWLNALNENLDMISVFEELVISCEQKKSKLAEIYSQCFQVQTKSAFSKEIQNYFQKGHSRVSSGTVSKYNWHPNCFTEEILNLLNEPLAPSHVPLFISPLLLGAFQFSFKDCLKQNKRKELKWLISIASNILFSTMHFPEWTFAYLKNYMIELYKEENLDLENILQFGKKEILKSLKEKSQLNDLRLYLIPFLNFFNDLFSTSSMKGDDKVISHSSLDAWLLSYLQSQTSITALIQNFLSPQLFLLFMQTGHWEILQTDLKLDSDYLEQILMHPFTEWLYRNDSKQFDMLINYLKRFEYQSTDNFDVAVALFLYKIIKKQNSSQNLFLKTADFLFPLIKRLPNWFPIQELIMLHVELDNTLNLSFYPSEAFQSDFIQKLMKKSLSAENQSFLLSKLSEMIDFEGVILELKNPKVLLHYLNFLKRMKLNMNCFEILKNIYFEHEKDLNTLLELLILLQESIEGKEDQKEVLKWLNNTTHDLVKRIFESNKLNKETIDKLSTFQFDDLELEPETILQYELLLKIKKDKKSLFQTGITFYSKDKNNFPSQLFIQIFSNIKTKTKSSILLQLIQESFDDLEMFIFFLEKYNQKDSKKKKYQSHFEEIFKQILLKAEKELSTIEFQDVSHDLDFYCPLKKANNELLLANYMKAIYLLLQIAPKDANWLSAEAVKFLFNYYQYSTCKADQWLIKIFTLLESKFSLKLFHCFQIDSDRIQSGWMLASIEHFQIEDCFTATQNPFYHTLLIYSLLNHYLTEQPDEIVLQKLFERNLIGMLVMGFSSHQQTIRHVAFSLFSKLYQLLSQREFPTQEKNWRHFNQLFLCIQLFKNAIEPSDSDSLPRLPFLWCLFISYALNICQRPHSDLYQPIQIFLLQRPRLDLTDFPLFYEFFYSTDVQAYKLHRKFLLQLIQYAKQCPLTHLILKRRFVLELLTGFKDLHAPFGLDSNIISNLLE